MTIADPQLADVLEMAFDAFSSNIHTAMPGRIESYSASQKKASVKPLIKKVFPDGEIMSMPVIDNVPVIWPGNGDALIHFPLERGDKVLLIFCERSLEYWLSGSGGEVEPGDPRKFSLSDAIAIPGLYTLTSSGRTTSGTGLEILYKDGSSIKLTATGDIELNGSTKKLVTYSELNSALQAMVSLLTGHVHTCTAPGSPSSTPTSPITLDISAAETTTLKTGG